MDRVKHKQAEDTEREHRRFAEALCDSVAVLTGSLDIDNVMQQLLDAAATVIPSKAGSSILFEGNEGRVAYLRGFTPEDAAFLHGYRFALNALIYGNVRTTRQPYFVPDTQAARGWITVPNSAWIRSSIGLPIERCGEVIGVLVVDSAIPHHFRPEDVEKLQAFAHYVSLAFENAYHIAQLEQKVADRTAELTVAKERVEAILNHSRDAILLVHPDLFIHQVNAAFYTLFAYAPDGYRGRSLGDLIDGTDIAHANVVIQTAIREQTDQQVEIRCYRENGTLFEAELSVSYILAMDIGTVDLVCTLRDITAHKQAAAALQQALQQEKELGVLKSRFVSMASHELRTPLTSILILTNTLRIYRHQLADEEITQRLDRIQEQVENLEVIIKDMLQLIQLQARRAEFNPVKLDLDALCRNILREFQDQHKAMQRVFYTCDSTLRMIKLDKKLMGQIINNLVANAIKYSSADKPILVNLADTGEILVLTVHDEGIGIPITDMHHLFEPFHRATNVGEIVGTGLGLSIVKEAVELHSGTVTVTSLVGVGTTFTVKLPVTASTKS